MSSSAVLLPRGLLCSRLLCYRFPTALSGSKRCFSTGAEQPAKRLTIATASATEKHLNNVELQGWVRRAHKTGGQVFLHISDGLSLETAQVVVSRGQSGSVRVGSAVRMGGEWRESQGSQQKFELAAKRCDVLAQDQDSRFAFLDADGLRQKLHLRAKSTPFASLLKLRSHLTMITHQFFQNRDFVHMDTPILTSNDCEGAGETFSIEKAKDFFGHQVFLTVSSQLHLEAMTTGIPLVYTLGRAFRAEKNQSSTHMSEFSMLEAEVGFCDSLDEMMTLAEDYLRHAIHALQSEESRELKGSLSTLSSFSESVAASIEKKIILPRLTYEEARRVAEASGVPLAGKGGLTRAAELAVVAHCQSPVFVTHFPVDQKPFYMKRSSCGEVTESFDLLAPLVGELAGGSLRAGTADDLERQAAEFRMPIGKALEWYSDLRRQGKPPSGGFGFGFERLLQVLLQVNNIKDTSAFPRWFRHCSS